MSSTKTISRDVGMVELVESPSRANGQFYIVKDDKGVQYYVSAIGGKIAHGVMVGTKFKLSVANPSAAVSIYLLTNP